MRQLFEPPLAETSELERTELLQAAAGKAAALLGLPGAPSADDRQSSVVDPSFALLHGLYWLCANLAAVAPLCVVVDDAHWADAPSLRYLAFLRSRGGHVHSHTTYVRELASQTTKQQAPPRRPQAL